MERYKVRPLKTKDIEVTVPGSKSITNRALLLAALADGESILRGALFSDDSRHFLQSLKDLGFIVDDNEQTKVVKVTGYGGKIPKKTGKIYVGSAGTAARFLTAMLGMSDGQYEIDASEQMKKRPMKPLFDALTSMGAVIEFLEEKDSLPVKIRGCFYKECQSKDTNGDVGVTVRLDISSSTQFLSAFLMIGCMCDGGLNIEITSQKKGGSYVDITMDMVRKFGGQITFDGATYKVANKPYGKMDYQIEPDVSAACYFYGMAAICGARALVRNVHLDSTQGDIRFINLMEQMGCKVEDTVEGIVVIGPDRSKGEKLKGIDNLDMNNFSDQALTLANVAIYADAPTTISNIEHIRGQECDRLNAIAINLAAMGIECQERVDSITIYPGTPKPANIETFEDHRVAMSFALPGLNGADVTILNPMCCKKTFEEYFEVIESLT